MPKSPTTNVQRSGFAWAALLPAYARAIKKLKKTRERWTVDWDCRRLAERRDVIIEAGRSGYRLPIAELGLDAANLERLRRAQQADRETILGEIDQDGFLLSNFGTVDHFVLVDRSDFLPRRRFSVQLVAVEGFVGIKKDYRGDKLSFVNEVRVLDRLRRAECRVPAILDVDFERLTLTISFIAGKVLREELAREGASLRDRELRQKTEYLNMERHARKPMRAEEGRRALGRVCSAEFITALYLELTRIQEAGVLGNDIKYGNVIVEAKSGEPYWIDFDHACCYKRRNRLNERYWKERDRERFNLFFPLPSNQL